MYNVKALKSILYIYLSSLSMYIPQRNVYDSYNKTKIYHCFLYIIHKIRGEFARFSEKSPGRQNRGPYDKTALMERIQDDRPGYLGRNVGDL